MPLNGVAGLASKASWISVDDGDKSLVERWNQPSPELFVGFVISCSCGIRGLSALRYEFSVVGLLTGVSRVRSQLIRKAWSAGGISTLDCRGIVKTPWAAVFMGATPHLWGGYLES